MGMLSRQWTVEKAVTAERVSAVSCCLSVCLSPPPSALHLVHHGYSTPTLSVSLVPIPGRSQFLVRCLCYSRCLKIVQLEWARSLPPDKVGYRLPVGQLCLCVSPRLIRTSASTFLILQLLNTVPRAVGIPDHEVVLFCRRYES